MTAPPCATGCKRPSPNAVICAECTAELARALVMAASIAGDLDDAAARLMTRGGGGRTSSEVPLPFDVEASEANRELRVHLASGIRNVNAVNGKPLRDSEPVPYSVRPMAAWLLEHLGELRLSPQAPRLYDTITAAVARAVRAVDRLPERAPAGQCEACGAQLLAELGADEVRCKCGILTAGLNARRRERAAAADVLGTPGEISGALYSLGIIVAASTIRTWASRGRLSQRPGGTPERPVYAMSEVMSLCAQRSNRG